MKTTLKDKAMKQKFKSGYEWDAHGKSRKYHSWRPGALRYVKNTLVRRFRKGQRKEIEEGLAEVNVYTLEEERLAHEDMLLEFEDWYADWYDDDFYSDYLHRDQEEDSDGYN